MRCSMRPRCVPPLQILARSLPDEVPSLHAHTLRTHHHARRALGQGLVDPKLLYTAIDWLQRDRAQF